MKFVLLTTAALLAGPAMAADMPAKTAAMNSFAADPPGWAGAYVGGTAGAGWDELKATAISGVKMNSTQFMPGGVAGYRWGKTLTFGLELNGVWAGHSDTIIPGITGKTQYFGDVSAQIGLALNKDLLIYAGAGPAMANSQISAGGVASTANNFGWVARVGFDTKLFTDNLVFGVVYAHYMLGDSTYFGVINASHSTDLVQARFLYRFGSVH